MYVLEFKKKKKPRRGKEGGKMPLPVFGGLAEPHPALRSIRTKAHAVVIFILFFVSYSFLPLLLYGCS